MKRVLLVTDGFFHPPFFGQRALFKALAKMDGVQLWRVSSMEKLPGDLQEYSALVIYVHHKEISAPALAALEAYVSAGGGLLGIHSATASFREHSRYFEILGGKFSGHGKVELFQVQPLPKRGVFYDLSAFTVRDELYLHELQPGITVHFTAKYQNEDVPVVWTHNYGQGRVCFASPGHTTQTMRNKAYQQVLRRGLDWVCKE